MTYNEDWEKFEVSFDKINKDRLFTKKRMVPNLLGLSLQDVLIFFRWIDYAKGIGDPSVDLLTKEAPRDKEIYRTAKKRIFDKI